MTMHATLRRNDPVIAPVSGWLALAGLLIFATVLGVFAGLTRLALGLGATTTLSLIHI